MLRGRRAWATDQGGRFPGDSLDNLVHEEFTPARVRTRPELGPERRNSSKPGIAASDGELGRLSSDNLEEEWKARSPARGLSGADRISQGPALVAAGALRADDTLMTRHAPSALRTPCPGRTRASWHTRPGAEACHTTGSSHRVFRVA